MKKVMAMVLAVYGLTAAGTAWAEDVDSVPLKHYQVLIALKDKPVETACLHLNPVIVDEFDGDPDMQGRGFEHQEIPYYKSSGEDKSCRTELQRNGDYIKTCNKLYLISHHLDYVLEEPHVSGLVFDRLARFDNQGKLIVQSLGQFILYPVEKCE